MMTGATPRVDLVRFGLTARAIDMLAESGMETVEEIAEELGKPHPGGESFFLRIPKAGRKSVDQLKLAVNLWEKENRSHTSAVLTFTECLDRFAEAERDMYHHSGTDTPEYDRARERRDRLRQALIETFEGMLR